MSRINTVGIIGLGLIGGSMLKTIRKHTDHKILIYNRSHNVTERALSENMADGELTHDNADECDILIVALMPYPTIDLIREYAPYLKKGCIVTDCTGVKSIIISALSKELNGKGICFVGGHPMAGKEVAGYDNADDTLYDNASMILCRDEYTDEDALSEASEFFRSIGFPRIKLTTPEEHDRVIAYTSQMAHVVSSAYIKSDTLSQRYGFSAGSFKDLTRVAKLNENMWADLFLANSDALLKEITGFMDHMEEYKEALERKDRERLVELLGQGRVFKETDEEKEKSEFLKLM